MRRRCRSCMRNGSKPIHAGMRRSLGCTMVIVKIFQTAGHCRDHIGRGTDTITAVKSPRFATLRPRHGHMMLAFGHCRDHVGRSTDAVPALTPRQKTVCAACETASRDPRLHHAEIQPWRDDSAIWTVSRRCPIVWDHSRDSGRTRWPVRRRHVATLPAVASTASQQCSMLRPETVQAT